MPLYPSALTRTALLTSMLACLGAVYADGAGATTFCVNATAAQHCTGTHEPDLQSALDAAHAAPNDTHRNTVKVGNPGTPPAGGYTYNTPNPATNPVDIVGAGTGTTTLTFSGSLNATVLSVNGDGSSASNLKIVIPASAGGTGLIMIGGSASGVLVTSPSPQSQSLTGIEINYGSSPSGPVQSLARSAVAFPATGAGPTAGVVTDVGAQASDVTVSGRSGGEGALIFGPPPAGYRTTSTARRIRIAWLPTTATAPGLFAFGQTVNADNVAIALPGGTHTTYGVEATAPGSGSTTLNVNHVSAYGNLDTASSPTFGVAASTSSGNVTLNVRNSVFRNFRYSFLRSAGGSGQANVRFDYSDGDLVHALGGGPGSATAGPGDFFHDVDPRWVNPAAGDFRLRRGSPVINAGDPAGLNPATESLVDVLGNPRISGGRRDMGAVEFAFPPLYKLGPGRFDKKSGKVRLTAKCRQPAVDRCRFAVRLKATVKRKRKHRKVTLSFRGSAAGGRSATLTAKLTRRALKIAKRHRSIRFAASGRVTDHAGAVAKIKAHVKLKRGKVKH